MDEKRLTPKKPLIRKRVQFLDTKVAETPIQFFPPTLPNICTNSNFCNYLQKWIMESRPGSAAIGYLEHSRCSKHLIYIDSKTQTVGRAAGGTPTLQSLHGMLQARKNDQALWSSLSVLHNIRLARQLGEAVLQFHATPWLHPTWNSEEVLVTHSVKNLVGLESSAPEAYVSVRIQGPHSALTPVIAGPDPLVVRNALLFRLGIMLLELAFSSTLSRLTTDVDRQTTDQSNVEFITADRLREQVSGHMGPKYAEVIRKCIHCDFGCDFDLKESKLQEGFYQDVICELEKLEQTMKTL